MSESLSSYNNFSLVREVRETPAPISLIHKSFQIQIEKLQTAYSEGIINEKEYHKWFELFDSFRREWLAKDFTKSENILFLKFIANQYNQVAKKLKFPLNKNTE